MPRLVSRTLALMLLAAVLWRVWAAGAAPTAGGLVNRR